MTPSFAANLVARLGRCVNVAGVLEENILGNLNLLGGLAREEVGLGEERNGKTD